jgi:hypothetical protein
VGAQIGAAGFLAAALPARRAVAPVGARLRAATRCEIVTAGPLRIVLDAAGTADDVVTADVVGAGVEIAAAGGTLRFDRRHTGVRVGLAAGRPVLAAAA